MADGDSEVARGVEEGVYIAGRGAGLLDLLYLDCFLEIPRYAAEYRTEH